MHSKSVASTPCNFFFFFFSNREDSWFIKGRSQNNIKTSKPIKLVVKIQTIAARRRATLLACRRIWVHKVQWSWVATSNAFVSSTICLITNKLRAPTIWNEYKMMRHLVYHSCIQNSYKVKNQHRIWWTESSSRRICRIQQWRTNH